MHAIVILNAAAGGASQSADAHGEIRAALEQAGIQAELRPTPGPDLAKAAREALSAHSAHPDAIIAAGGDGTVSAVASALAGSAVPLGILPVGTLNHFAKDLGLPQTLPEAARIIAAGHIRQVDVGLLDVGSTSSADARVFVNNSSIGLYPRIVDHRDSQMRRFGRGKWPAMLSAFFSVFRRFPTVRVRIATDDQAVTRTTPFVFIGNNEYDIDRLNLGGRQRLDAGALCLYFTNRTGRLGLLRLAFRLLVGHLDQDKDFNAMCVTELWIDSHKRHLRVALDGETQRLSPPLHYHVAPQSLRVFAPRETTSDS